MPRPHFTPSTRPHQIPYKPLPHPLPRLVETTSMPAETTDIIIITIIIIIKPPRQEISPSGIAVNGGGGGSTVIN